MYPVSLFNTTSVELGPLLLPWFNLNPSNYIRYKVWDEITYLFLTFNGATVEVDEIAYAFLNFDGATVGVWNG